MKKNVFGSCPKYLGALTWNHPTTSLCFYKIPCILNTSVLPKTEATNWQLVSSHIRSGKISMFYIFMRVIAFVIT